MCVPMAASGCCAAETSATLEATTWAQSSDSVRPPDCSPPSAPVRGSLQARRLEWVAISSSRGSLPSEPPGKPKAIILQFKKKKKETLFSKQSQILEGNLIF